jgi:hypothetical protein
MGCETRNRLRATRAQISVADGARSDHAKVVQDLARCRHDGRHEASTIAAMRNMA